MGKKLNASAQTALATIAKASAESTIAANIAAMASDTPATDYTDSALPDSTAVTVANTNAAIAAMGMADVSAIIDSTQTVKADTKTFVTSSKNFIRCGEVLSVAVALMHLTNHHNKESLRQVLVKAKGLSTPLRNALRVIIPCLTYEKGIVMYDMESGHVDVVTLDNGKQSVRPRIDFDALDVLLFQARRVMLTPRDQWRMIDIVSESWKATFPTLDKVELLKNDVQAWREKQIKAMVKNGFDESAARAFVAHQTPLHKA